MLHLLEFEIGILVLNTSIGTQHITLCIIVSRWCRGAGSVYPETLCIRKKSPYWPFAKLAIYGGTPLRLLLFFVTIKNNSKQKISSVKVQNTVFLE